MKHQAFLEYLKSFSYNSMESIQKLGKQFKDEINSKSSQSCVSMMHEIKILLASYQVLIFEMNDAFTFIQVPQYGCCIVRVFLQIMSVLQYLIKIILNPKSTKQQQQKQDNPTIESLNQQKEAFDNQKQIYKAKQQTRYLINQMNKQCQAFDQQNNNNFNNQILTIKNLLENKQKTLKLQVSQSENIIRDAMYYLSRKNENFKKFVELRQKQLNSNKCQSTKTADSYSIFVQVIEDQKNNKSDIIKDKLRKMIQTYTIKYIETKKNTMRSQQIQVKIQEPIVNEIVKPKHHQIQLMKIQNELQFQKDKNKKLQMLYAQKNIQFHQQLMKFRNQNMRLQRKTKKQIMSKSNISQKQITKRDVSFEESIAQKQNQSQKQEQGGKLSFNYVRKNKLSKNICETQGYKKKNQVNIFNNHFKQKMKINIQIEYKFIPKIQIQRQEFKQIQMLTLIDNQSKFQDNQTQTLAVLYEKKFKHTAQIYNIAILKQEEKQQDQNSKNDQLLSKISSSRRDTLISFQKVGLRDSIEKQKRRVGQRIIIRTSRLNQIWKDQLKNSKNKDFAPTQSKGKVERKMSPFNTSENQQFDQQAGANLLQKPIKARFDKIQCLNFTKEDVANLFISLANAKNYEYLNYSSVVSTQKNYYIPVAKYKPLTQNLYQLNYSKGKNIKKQIWRMMDTLLLKQLHNLKKKKLTVHQNLRNFIRYPYSSISLSNDQNWVKYAKQQSDIQYWQIIKNFNRIFKIHEKCNQHKKINYFCSHIYKFYEKIGIRLS